MMMPLLLLAATAATDTTAGRFLAREHVGEHGTLPYRLYLPSRYDGKGTPPLLVMLHGCTQDAADFAAGTRMNELAEEAGAVVMYPEQPASTHPQRCWRWYEPEHQRPGGGEPALIVAAIQEVMREVRADPDRVYVAGVSAGGAMAVILAAGYPDLFAAVGSHSGVAYGVAAGALEALGAMQQPPSAPPPLPASARVPLIIFHGADDRVVRSGHAGVLAAQWAGGAVVEQRRGPGAGRGYLHLRATAPVAVEGWVVDGLGHAWSGGSALGSYTDPEGPDASWEMIRFFLAHRRQTTR